MLSATFTALLLAGATAQPANAAIKVVDFTLFGPWTNFDGPGSPYGLPAQPTITGSADVDDTKTNASAIVGLDFATGTKTWTLADIKPDSQVVYSGGSISGLKLILSGQTGFATFATAVNGVGASIGDGRSLIFGKVRIDSVSDRVAAVPEPASWALAILGFGAVGTVARRKRADRQHPAAL